MSWDPLHFSKEMNDSILRETDTKSR